MDALTERHSRATIVSMAVIASAAATLLHEGLGHGVVAWMRGDIPTELTSNHLSALHPDHWVEASGTLVNLFIGAICLWAALGCRQPGESPLFFVDFGVAESSSRRGLLRFLRNLWFRRLAGGDSRFAPSGSIANCDDGSGSGVIRVCRMAACHLGPAILRTEVCLQHGGAAAVFNRRASSVVPRVCSIR